MSVRHQGKVLTSVLASTLTGWRGTRALAPVKAAAQPLVLFDIEACPYCRAVRQALTALRLDVLIQPCPKGGTRFRGLAQARVGKQQFPLLIDPNTGEVLLESAEIIDYLFATYGREGLQPAMRPTILATRFSELASLSRGLRGLKAHPARPAEQPLQLWSFESSPYSRLVRERLCELELPYVLHNLGKEQFADLGPARLRVRPGPYKPLPDGPRAVMLAPLGRVQVPYLEDPNSGRKLFESEDILAYLDHQYAL